MANFFTDNSDLQFQYHNALQWDELVATTERRFTLPGGPKNTAEARAFYDEVLHLVGDLSANEIAPQAAAIDREGSRLVDGEVELAAPMQKMMNTLRDAGLFGMNVPRELGGSNCPLAVQFVANELIARADVSVMSHAGFHGGTAVALLAYATVDGDSPATAPFTPSRWDHDVKEIVEGKAWGCMVLTEPGAGSDLGAISTVAKERDGHWYITGNKIFITSGHGQYQLVLARSEPRSHNDAAMDGLKGLSLFLVRRRIERDGKLVDNVRVEKVEHKLGHHGSPTCSLVYEDSRAELIGKRGQGFELMLMMMNGARVAVGFESIGLCQAAYQMASDYAGFRSSMGKRLDQHELIAEMLMDMELDIVGLRALAFEAINCQELSQKYELELRFHPPKGGEELAILKARAKKLKRRARELTPLLKYLGGEKAVEMSRRNMQIHGGAGYMAEIGAEKLMRDALVIPVYEGTSQIQALMALKDRLMDVLRDPTTFARRMSAASIKVTTGRTQLERQLNSARLEANRAMTHLIGRIAGKKLRAELGTALREIPAHDWPRYMTGNFMREWDMKVDFSYGLLHAERLTKILADVEIANVLCKQAALFPERRPMARRYLNRMLPRVRALSEEIRSGDDSVFEWLRERAERETSQSVAGSHTATKKVA